MYPVVMALRYPLIVVLSVLTLLGCRSSSAQSPKNTEALRKEVEQLKAAQAEMQKSLDEIRDFLKAATGGRFGSPPLAGSSVEITGAPVNGSASAPVTMIEVSDYHCPFCRRHFQQTQPQLFSDYIRAGKVRHVFLHYPIDQLHPDAYRSHEAASCAADQGKFWELHAKLFEAPVRTVDQLISVAQSAGLEAGAFRTCLESSKHAQEVKDSVARIQKMGISGTPVFLIGRTPAGAGPVKVSKIVEGAQPYEAFQKAIDEVLAQR
jgi:protein-disulfide isomerase